jgi:hypothetical protein
MGVSLKTDVNWGKVFYLKNDPYQLEHTLTGFVVRPGGVEGKNVVKLILSHQGEETTVYDFEASTDRDELKFMESKGDDDED